ncbi:DNA-directed RNA polymerase subunit L [Candidatus Woesearchaeota archaeon]|nr:DNA-directed RNA polymerase subunit L [Candidatus Woesearchaeota archaeon]
MKLKVLEEKKNKMVFELKGESHTFCNALKQELWNDKHVKIAGYNIAHPLIGVPKFIVETDGNESSKKALIDAAKRIKNVSDKFKTAFLKGIK